MEPPLAVTLKKLPPGEILSESQWQVLLAIADTIVPSLSSLTAFADPKLREGPKEIIRGYSAPSVSPEVIEQYLEENASKNSRFRELLDRQLNLYIPKSDSKELAMVLSVLSTRVGSLLLTGRPTPFHLQTNEIREKIVHGWRSSCIPALRVFAAKMIVLCGKTWLATSETHTTINGVPEVPVNTTRNSSFDFVFLDFPADSSEAVVDTDVVVIGSGCGGGVCAKNIAEAGIKVLVVDKGHHYSTAHFPMGPIDGPERLFENGGAVIADNASIITIPGSTWGGGGTVNWSASLHTQTWVREEWAREGLKFFEGEEFQACLDRVAERMGVSTKYINHNFANNLLLEGGKKLGYTGFDIPQNTGNKVHDCGYCTQGCAAAAKQGPSVSFLPDAANAGAKFMDGFLVERILFDGPDDSKARGIVGQWQSKDGGITRKVRINAKKVIVSAGTLNSPLILLRSGLKNKQIGQNLHLHPVSFIRARYDQEVRPWEGAIMTRLVDLQHSKIEIPSMLPVTLCLMTAWRGGLEYKVAASSYSHWVAMIALLRDRDSGRIYPDKKHGECRMAYTASAYDRQHLLEGVVAAAKIHYAMGAKEIASTNPNLENFIRVDAEAHPEETDTNGRNGTNGTNGTTPTTATPKAPTVDNDKAFERWLADLQKHGIASPYPAIPMMSAHQMGTCRMSIDPSKGVVDEKGKVWGKDNLYVCDASVFPSASGVNPMLTTMGISDWISRGIARDWEKGEATKE